MFPFAGENDHSLQKKRNRRGHGAPSCPAHAAADVDRRGIDGIDLERLQERERPDNFEHEAGVKERRSAFVAAENAAHGF